MKRIHLHLVWAVLAGILGSTNSFAQGYIDDAQRVAQPLATGTARTLSLGGAFSSLGGDVGTLSSNPAGLGFYRRSDLSITPQWSSAKVTSTYFYNKQDDKYEDFRLINVGSVYAYSTPSANNGSTAGGRLVSFAFGIGYARNGNINRNTTFSGSNNGASFGSFLAGQANAYGINASDYGSALAGIAYDEYLINPTNQDNTNFAPVQASNVGQSGRLQERGYTDETNLSFGVNLGNILYLGAGLNYDEVNYQSVLDFSETGIKDPASKIDGITFSKSINQRGNGVNGKFGVIFNILNALHFGGYVQTPTKYEFDEATDMGMWGLNKNQLIAPSISTKDESGNATDGTYAPIVSSADSYHIRTPFKYTVGASVLFDKLALITGDATYIDYKETRFYSGSSATDLLINDGLKAKYKSVVNYKVGAELRFGPTLLRAGYAFYPSAIEDKTTNADQRVISGGIGVHLRQFYVDVTGMRDYSRTYRQLYSLSDGTGPVLKQYNTISSGVVTVGARF